MATLPPATRVFNAGGRLSLTITFESTGQGEAELRSWIGDVARRSGEALRTAIAGAVPHRSGTLANSIQSEYRYPTLFVGSDLRYARYQAPFRDAVERFARATDASLRTLTRQIPFPLNYRGVWIVRLFGQIVRVPIAGRVVARQRFRFADCYSGYQIIEGTPYGAAFTFRLPRDIAPV